MIKKIIFIFTLCICAISCTRDPVVDNTNYVDAPEVLAGSWNWLYSSGGLAGVTYTPESTGEVKRIEIDADNNYRYYVNGILKTASTFRLEKTKSTLTHDSVIMVTNLLGFKQSLKFQSSDTLLLQEDCFDCFGHCYSRIK